MIVLIPAYQPDQKLIDLVRSIGSADPYLLTVIVDDGSGAKYQHIFDTASRLGCLVLGYPDNRGKGHALKAGFSFIAERLPGEAVVCADADGQHRVVDILRVGARVGSCSSTMVLGTRRFSGEVPLRSRIGNTTTRLLFRLATGRQLSDTQTGLRGYPAPMLPWLRSVRGERYEYELNLLLQASRIGARIETIDIATVYLEENQSSHFRPVADSVRIYAPLLMFLISSLIAFAADAVGLLVLNALTGSLLLSVVGARAISSALNFLVNRRLVFAGAGHRRIARAATGYFALVLTLLGLNYGLLAGLTTAGLALLPAKLLTELLLVTISYTVQRRLIFAAVPASRPPLTSLPCQEPSINPISVSKES